ncbi:hypothetical protein [Paenibacillus crassostreae]|nr:hypothetical protein [Paenibacillus crassostreae]
MLPLLKRKLHNPLKKRLRHPVVLRRLYVDVTYSSSRLLGLCRAIAQY